MNSSFTPFNTESFSFTHSIGTNDSMKDYTKMCILLSFDLQYQSYYEKCKMIKEKFVEQYGGNWRVIMLKKGDGGSYGDYKNVYIYVTFKGYDFIILNNIKK